MEPTGSQLFHRGSLQGRRGERSHFARLVADDRVVAGDVAQTELPLPRSTPAFQLAVGQQRAVVAEADREARGVAGGDGGCQRVAHLARGVAHAVVGSAAYRPAGWPDCCCHVQAHLTPGVETPALHCRVVENGAVVTARCEHGDSFQPGPEIDVRQSVAHFAGVVAEIGGVALAELAPLIVAPALHMIAARGVLQDRARMVMSQRNRSRRQAGPEIDGRGSGDVAGRYAQRRGVTLPQLTAGVDPPTLHRVVIEPRAGEILTGGDLDRGAARPEVDGLQRSHLARARRRDWPCCPVPTPRRHCGPSTWCRRCRESRRCGRRLP